MRSSAFTRAAAVATALVSLALGAGAGAASAASIGGFGARPAHPDPSNPATRAYFILRQGRGSVRHELALVTNASAAPLTLDVDPVDGLTGVTAGVVYGDRGVALRGAGAWVTPAVRRVTVPAHSSITVGFVVRVPRSALRGDHLAGLAFEARRPAASGGNFSVTVRVRTVVGVEIVVPGRATARLRLYSLALRPLPGTRVPSVVVSLEDDGHKLCHPQLTVALTGRSSTSRASQTLGTILPGDRIPFPFRWPGALSEGRYAISARATRCGPPQSIHTIASFSLAGAPKAPGQSTPVVSPAPLASGGSGSGGVPWWLIVAVGAGGILAGALFARHGRRGRRASR